MSGDIIGTSRRFFHAVVLPLVERRFPRLAARMACGVFGYGSEVLRRDDELSRDHHWGLRVDMLLPDTVYRAQAQALLAAIVPDLPERFEDLPLRDAHVAGHGIAPESLTAFLRRTIGLEGAPRSLEEWLDVPEVDIVHVTNGEVWHDPAGDFTAVRQALLAYYPEPVWLRRIAHWCRYASGMGAYGLHRALRRGNLPYAFVAFSRCLKLSLELAFLLERTYFPYDKWLYPMFLDLPMAASMDPLVRAAVHAGTSWARRLDLLGGLADILDAKMVDLGVIPEHAPLAGSETSGYRLLEHAYGVIVKRLPEAVRRHVPCWDQVPLEAFHTGYVAGLPEADWDAVLHLRPRSPGG